MVGTSNLGSWNCHWIREVYDMSWNWVCPDLECWDGLWYALGLPHYISDVPYLFSIASVDDLQVRIFHCFNGISNGGFLGVPPNHPFADGFCLKKNAHFGGTTILGNLQIDSIWPEVQTIQLTQTELQDHDIYHDGGRFVRRICFAWKDPTAE